jgi:hypothetical protein
MPDGFARLCFQVPAGRLMGVRFREVFILLGVAFPHFGSGETQPHSAVHFQNKSAST